MITQSLLYIEINRNIQHLFEHFIEKTVVSYISDTNHKIFVAVDYILDRLKLDNDMKQMYSKDFHGLSAMFFILLITYPTCIDQHFYILIDNIWSKFYFF